MVKFLENVTCKGQFEFKEGQVYEHIEDFDNKENKDFIFVKQPNSPKKEDWYCKFPRKCEGEVFNFID